MNVKTLLNQAAQQGLDSLDAQLLLGYVLQCSRAWLVAHADDAVHPDQADRYAALVAQRAAGKPVAYLLGSRDFWDSRFRVTDATLIPRPETELLIELALQLKPRPRRILDLGTGSGIIAITLARQWPEAQLTAADLHQSALDVADENARAHNLNNLTLLQSDWYAALDSSCRFDLIISNPPYIAPDDHHLQQLGYEPRHALVAAEHGLADLRTIIDGADRFLEAGGWLMLEHGYDQQAAVQHMLQAAGMQRVETHRDLAGQPRASVAQKRS